MIPATPGPWKVSGLVGAAIWITDESANNQIAMVYGVLQTLGAQANARLIASAPALLKALKAVIGPMRREHDAGDGWLSTAEVEAAEAAIRQAEGGE